MLHFLMASDEQKIERCRKMIDECRAYDGPDKTGAMIGELDNMVELKIIEESKRKNEDQRTHS